MCDLCNLSLICACAKVVNMLINTTPSGRISPKVLDMLDETGCLWLGLGSVVGG